MTFLGVAQLPSCKDIDKSKSNYDVTLHNSMTSILPGLCLDTVETFVNITGIPCTTLIYKRAVGETEVFTLEGEE